jgi:hypothetical protein
MAGCPYTWVRGFFAGAPRPTKPGEPAQHLMVTVVKNGEQVVKVSLPARSARRLIDLMPDDVIAKVRAEAVPLDDMMAELQGPDALVPRPIFQLVEPHREVSVWLE